MFQLHDDKFKQKNNNENYQQKNNSLQKVMKLMLGIKDKIKRMNCKKEIIVAK